MTHPTHKPATTDMWSPADTLRAVAVYLQRHGWTQGAFYDRADTVAPATPPACVIGGIGIVVHGIADDCPGAFTHPGAADYAAARDLLTHHLATVGQLDPTADTDDPLPATLSDWNDDGWRTATDVIHACHAAADHYDHSRPTGGAA